jgi:hypothetical protein
MRRSLAVATMSVAVRGHVEDSNGLFPRPQRSLRATLPLAPPALMSASPARQAHDAGTDRTGAQPARLRGETDSTMRIDRVPSRARWVSSRSLSQDTSIP